jgi:UrcA family protein
MLGIVALATNLATAASMEAQDPPATRVQYGDLNLAAAADVAVLKRRVLAAAMRVCVEQYGGDPLGGQLERVCVRRATNRALAQINWPRS